LYARSGPNKLGLCGHLSARLLRQRCPPRAEALVRL